MGATVNLPDFGLTHWLTLMEQFLGWSLMSVGGAIATIPDMHRSLVMEHQWLTEAQFTAAIALAQAAPGPNVLFVPLMGWQIGINASGGALNGLWPLARALMGACVALAGILLPSTTLTLAATRWAHRNRQRLGVRAFKQGLAPVALSLLLATGWILASKQGSTPVQWLGSAVVALVVWRSRLHLLWLLAAGAALGMAGIW
jgi:chromate transporter